MGAISDCNFATLKHNLSLTVKSFRDEYLSASGIMGKLKKFSMSAPTSGYFSHNLLREFVTLATILDVLTLYGAFPNVIQAWVGLSLPDG
jgi:hypothetical protein